MTPTAATDALIALFEREGYVRVEPPVLQPADVFIDLSGEDIRRRMFVAQDADGREVCLRPEYTIPVCRQHLATIGTQPASYAYRGPVFRLRAGASGEFFQAGIESIGRTDASAADAEVVALALEGLDALGLGEATVRLGDMGLLGAVVDALGLAPATKRRLMRAIVSGRGLAGLSAWMRRQPRPNTPDFSPPSKARRRRPPRRSSRTSSPSPGSRASAAGPRARSPSAFWRAPPTGPACPRRRASSAPLPRHFRRPRRRCARYS